MNNLKKVWCLVAFVSLLAVTTGARAQTIAGPITNPANAHNYYVIRTGSFSDYKVAAQNLAGYPVVINNAAENAWIVAHLLPVLSPPFTYAYIGLSDAVREGEWRWEAGVTDRYTNWRTGQPSGGGIEDYAIMSAADGQWDDTVAPPANTGSGLAYALVEVGGGNIGEPAGVFAGPVCDPATGDDYYVLTNSHNGPARVFAQTNLGGDLASIRSAAQNEFIARHVAGLVVQGGYVAIGLNDLATEGQYRWFDGTPVTYTRWLPGEPNNINNNEDYVGMVAGGGSTADFGGWLDLPDYVLMSIVRVKHCGGDFNRSGVVSVQDIFDFLAAYFGGCP